MSETFVGTLAFIFGILSTLLVIGRICAWSFYDETEEMRDRIRGVRAEFPVMYPSIVAIICWTWVFTH
jgi:hypothetical protein